MTTLSMGYVRGIDEVRRSDVADFAEDGPTRVRVGVTQVLSRFAIAEVVWETISDEGFLNNPYRQVRFEDPDAAGGFLGARGLSGTRTSNAIALHTRWHLPWRGALQFDYRYFEDDWGVQAQRPRSATPRHLRAPHPRSRRAPAHADRRRLLLGSLPAPRGAELSRAQQGNQRLRQHCGPRRPVVGVPRGPRAFSTEASSAFPGNASISTTRTSGTCGRARSVRSRSRSRRTSSSRC